MAHLGFTEEIDKEILELRKKGVIIREIAARLGTNRSVIQRRVAFLIRNIHRNSPTSIPCSVERQAKGIEPLKAFSEISWKPLFDVVLGLSQSVSLIGIEIYITSV